MSNKNGTYQVEVKGKIPSSKIELKKNNSRKFTLQVMLKNKILFIDKNDWKKAVKSPSISNEEYGIKTYIVIAGSDLVSSALLPEFSFQICNGNTPYQDCYADCDCHIGNANITLHNAQKHFECLIDQLKMINIIKEIVLYHCQESFPLSDSDKNSLHNHLTLLANWMNNYMKWYDKLINDMEQHLDKYKKCRES